MWAKFKNVGVITTIGFAGWLGGTIVERNKHCQCEQKTKEEQINLTKFPALPVFGTVSAATPIKNQDKESRFLQVQSRTSEIMKFGFPGLDHVRSFDDFVLSYDRRNKVAHWVFEHLTEERLKNNQVDRTLCDFTEDTSMHPYFRSSNKDYKGSGYDRGHLAAAGNHRLDQSHCDQTFYLTNIAPQVGVGFNRDSWNRLERHTRKLTKTYPNVYVCTGPLYLPRKEANGKTYIKFEVIGVNHVAVPTHFFKVVVMETNDKKLHMEAYVMPNEPIDDSTPLHLYQVSPDTIERHAGLLFFDRLSRDKLVQINGRKTTFV